MKSHPVLIIAATAGVSFLLGVASTSVLRKSEKIMDPLTEASSPKSKSRRLSEGSPDPMARETNFHSPMAYREEKKKPSERQVSIPLADVAEIIRKGQFSSNSDFLDLRQEMEKSLTLLGTSRLEKAAVLALLKKTESAIYAEEKKLIKVVQTDGTEIRLDHQAMEAFSKTIAPQIQEGIRSLLSADLAEVLISSTKWDVLYPTDEKSFPAFSITRSPSGIMIALFCQSNSQRATGIDSKFKDDGTPIPADQVFKDTRWQHLLKGLTLLPRDEK